MYMLHIFIVFSVQIFLISHIIIHKEQFRNSQQEAVLRIFERGL
mgnify:CR=1 FL=1